MPVRKPSSVAPLEHFSALRYPRQRWRVIYALPEILLLVLCASVPPAVSGTPG